MSTLDGATHFPFLSAPAQYPQMEMLACWELGPNIPVVERSSDRDDASLQALEA